MEMLVCKTSQELTERAHQWCQLRTASCAVRSMFVPAGNTPTPLYEFWEKTRPSYLEGRRLLQIDDVLTGPSQGLFARYFHEHLPSFRQQLVQINAADETADLAILGFGLNGHIAFHEPHLPLNFFSGCVSLSEESRRTLGLTDETWGVTYGLEAFRRTKAVLLMVAGVKKKEMFRRFLAETDTFPASGLKRHSDLTVLVDFDPWS